MTHVFAGKQTVVVLIAFCLNWLGLVGLPANWAIANEASPPSSATPPSTPQPDPLTGATDRQPEPTAAERSPDPLKEDRVYISDVYPEYCRSYFFRRDWVSLFEYRETMYRCLYGPDRWR